MTRMLTRGRPGSCATSDCSWSWVGRTAVGLPDDAKQVDVASMLKPGAAGGGQSEEECRADREDECELRGRGKLEPAFHEQRCGPHEPGDGGGGDEVCELLQR